MHSASRFLHSLSPFFLFFLPFALLILRFILYFLFSVSCTYSSLISLLLHFLAKIKETYSLSSREERNSLLYPAFLFFSFRIFTNSLISLRFHSYTISFYIISLVSLSHSYALLFFLLCVLHHSFSCFSNLLASSLFLFVYS